MRFFHSFILIAAAALPFVAAAPTGGASHFNPISIRTVATTVADNYIIVMKDTVDTETFQNHRAWAAGLHANRLTRRDDASLTGIKHNYTFDTMKGYSGAFDAATIAAINARDEVDFVEPDSIMTTLELIAQENVPSWGIARISQRSDADETTYFFDTSAGNNVTAYVIDTGVNTAHVEFGGRATFGANFADNVDTDEVGHGTHVSGTIAGTTFGVAKNASIIAVKVLGADGSGTNSGVIAGVQWAANDASTKGASNTSVANMSLGGSFSAALNRAVAAAIASGMTFCVAAGNDDENAATSSPASVSTAITVGASDETDARAFFSNFGSSVDVFAPGLDITSAWIGNTTANNTISGTSMATPHVVGLVAYLIGLEGLSGSSAITARIKSLATTGVVTHPGRGSPNLLIYNGSGR
ncbi:hypothetical protein RUND412_009722 [Rhizina undulata]